MPRKGHGGPVCGAPTPSGTCKAPIALKGDRCHRHPYPPAEAKKVNAERFKNDLKIAEAKFQQSFFARTALKYGLDAKETREAYDRMVIANGPNPPVPEWSKKP